MIKGEAILDFGTGDIRTIVGLGENGLGVLCLSTTEPHIIGHRSSMPVNWTGNDEEVIMTFTKLESIDILIDELKDVKSMMLLNSVNHV